MTIYTAEITFDETYRESPEERQLASWLEILARLGGDEE